MTTALRDADVLVFEQRAQLVEVTMEYRILDAEGRQVGLVRQERLHRRHLRPAAH